MREIGDHIEYVHTDGDNTKLQKERETYTRDSHTQHTSDQHEPDIGSE